MNVEVDKIHYFQKHGVIVQLGFFPIACEEWSFLEKMFLLEKSLITIILKKRSCFPITHDIKNVFMHECEKLLLPEVWEKVKNKFVVEMALWNTLTHRLYSCCSLHFKFPSSQACVFYFIWALLINVLFLFYIDLNQYFGSCCHYFSISSRVLERLSTTNVLNITLESSNESPKQSQDC